jgi:iron complex transport system substrate-binding protein
MNGAATLDEILIRLDEKPPRIVSLVPSYTESLFDLGFGKYVVGVTEYCVHPASELASVQRVGSVRAPDINCILGLAPDVVLANQEENSPETVRSLEQAGVSVWLSFPKSVDEMFEVLVGFVRFYHDEAASLRVRMLETSFDWAVQAAADQPKLRFFCPIWQGKLGTEKVWWMTFNQDTYASDLLEKLGGLNVFTGRTRRYPLEADLGLATAEEPGLRDTRYPRVSLEEVIASQPEVILLPDEPFTFDDAARSQLMELLHETPAVKAQRIYNFDGSVIAWYGTRIGLALESVPNFFLI